jgi:hypothetical protein
MTVGERCARYVELAARVGPGPGRRSSRLGAITGPASRGRFDLLLPCAQLLVTDVSVEQVKRHRSPHPRAEAAAEPAADVAAGRRPVARPVLRPLVRAAVEVVMAEIPRLTRLDQIAAAGAVHGTRVH